MGEELAFAVTALTIGALATGAFAGAATSRMARQRGASSPPVPEEARPEEARSEEARSEEARSDPVRPLYEVLELLPEPMLLLDRRVGLRHANLAAREPFGDVLAALLRHPAVTDALERLQDQAIVTALVTLDVPVRRVLRVSLKALPRAYPNLLIVSIMDHTQQAAMTRMREDFIANASHELRTPLASLIGFIDTLLGPAADDAPAQRRFLAIMQTQAARMQRLIDNLLNLSRIQLTEHERPRGAVSLAQVAAHVAGEFEPLMRARQVGLVLELDEALPPVQGDADQLAQVVQNLLDNALKYARSRITLSARPAAGDTPSLPWPLLPWPTSPGLVLAVADDGPGIAAHHLPRLTERFYRAEEGNAKAGSGLGLAIVKHIVGRHLGRLQIESAEGQGCRFSVWLPAAAVMQPS